MTSELIDRVEATLDTSQDDLADELPELLDELDGQVRDVFEEDLSLFGGVVATMDEMAVAPFVDEHPDVADQFQELLWTGTELLVEQNPDVQDQLSGHTTVNFEADDCSMEGHLEIDGEAGTITGGAGTIDDPTLHITGPADTLVGLLTGSVDPVQGFMSQQYEMDGPVAKGTQLAPIMSNLAESVPS